jgi:hypothetical protein
MRVGRTPPGLRRCLLRRWAPRIAVAVVVATSASRALAQGATAPPLPVGPFGEPAPTPASPAPSEFLPSYDDAPENMPPFAAPLPPAVPLPPRIRVLPAVPPPEGNPPRHPFEMYPAIPARPGRPPPLRLPERPDDLMPPAGGLRQSLSEYDRQIGLGGTGPVVSLAREVGMSEWVTGEATIAVVVDRSGVIRSARLVDASRDTAGWRRYTEKLGQSARSGMRLPEQARGAWALLYVRIDNERPTGRERWWSPGVAITFDLSNAGSRKVRSVHPRVLGEVWF